MNTGGGVMRVPRTGGGAEQLANDPVPLREDRALSRERAYSSKQ